VTKKNTMSRCAWALGDALLLEYHDKEWGVPVHDDVKLFEFLTLEGMQAGLSWLTILKKRENLRKAFSSFDPAKVAGFSESDVNRLLSNPGIIRNRLKVSATITNARKFLSIEEEFGSFDCYVWGFTNGRTMRHRFRSLSAIPARTRESDMMSKDLQRRGFKFVGSTICYAFMQAVGIVNDHTVTCFRHSRL
jgi:DNA-3-methyladenine glycosylase I